MEKKRTHKLTNEDIKNIGVSYYLNKSNSNINDLCKKYDISRTYFFKLVKQERTKELARNSINENAPLFTEKVDAIINQALDKIQYKLNQENTDQTTYRDLAIMIGTLYDKSRLEKNLSTENKAVEINIKVEH